MKEKKNSLDKWIKSALENKINTKNTWEAPLINYFHEISYKNQTKNINFTKATTMLDGCVKIYSSRVDDVADNASKLANSLFTKIPKSNLENNDNSHNNKKIKKAVLYAVKNTKSINANLLKTFVFEDVFFKFILQANIKYFIHPYCKETKNGRTMFTTNYTNKIEIILDNVQTTICAEKRLICPSISNMIVNLENKEIENAAPVPEFANLTALKELESEVSNDNLEEHEESHFDDNANDLVNMSEASDDVEVHKIDDGVLQNVSEKEKNISLFTGIKSWKISHVNKKIKKQRKNQTPYKIDFFSKINTEFLYQIGNTIQPKETIKMIRSKKLIMDGHEIIDSSNLYRKCIKKEEFFKPAFLPEELENKEKSIIQHSELDYDVFDNHIPNCDMIYNEVDLQEKAQNMDEEIKLQNVFKDQAIAYTKKAKKVDLFVLKRNILSKLSHEKSLNNVYKLLNDCYEKEEFKEISKHFCFISLLHVATENEIYLKDDLHTGDIKIIK